MQVADNPRYSEDAEIQRKLQALRVILLSMGDLFQSELIAEYSTFKLYVYEVTGMDRFSAEDPASTDVIDEFNQQEFVTMAKLNALRAHRHHVGEVAQQAWAMLQTLMNNLAELTVRFLSIFWFIALYVFRFASLKSFRRTHGLWVLRFT